MNNENKDSIKILPPPNWYICSYCSERLIGNLPIPLLNDKLEVEDDGSNLPWCSLCFGILQNKFGLNILSIFKEKIYNIVIDSKFEFDSVQLQITMPLLSQLYEAVLASYLFPQQNDINQRQAFINNIHPIKYVWNILTKEQLSQLFQKPLLRRKEDATIGSLILEIHFELQFEINQSVEAEFLYNIISELTGKPRKRRYEQMGTGRKSHDASGHSAGLYRLGRETVANALNNCSSERLLKEFQIHPHHESLSVVNHPPLVSLKLHGMHRVGNLCVAGRYCKFSRRLPHTPWLVDECRRLDDSVEEIIARPLCQYFSSTDGTFSSSGREDVDVRMLGNGRPFLYELTNYLKIPTEQIGEHLQLLEKEINSSSNGRLIVRDLQLVTSESAKSVKVGEESKTKRYQGLCWCNEIMNKQLINEINKNYEENGISIEQWTPVRVLHRRSLLKRKREIYSLKISEFDQSLDIVNSVNHPLESYSTQNLFLIDIHCQAGTYIKEFVHGDLGRTSPNLATMIHSLLQKSKTSVTACDMLALDVMEVDLKWPPEICQT